MTEIWEEKFIQNKEMWGFEPAHAAILTKDFFVKKAIKNILIPGFGYGRNAKIFEDNGMTVTGIEISETAIELARKRLGSVMTIHHGSVTNMPFDDHHYDGIFCYALIHLLDEKERKRLILNCYNQLIKGGYMVFAVVSKEAPIFGQGIFISKDRYEVHKGTPLFFYDKETVKAEFNNAGLVEIKEINDIYPFYLVTCRKE